MKNEKNNFFIIAIFALFFVVFSANIYNSVQSYKLRRLCNQYRESLTRAEETNRIITDRIERVAEITGRIKEATNANITDARGIVETVEVLRTQIKELEDCCGSFNLFEYYQYWDSYYRDEQLMD